MSGDGERSPLLPAELGEPGTPGAGGVLAGPGGLVPSAPLPPYGGPAAEKPAPPHGERPRPHDLAGERLMGVGEGRCGRG